MKGPDQYDVDDQLMDELGGAMDDMDSKKFMPVVQVTVSVSKPEEGAPEEAGEEPTPEEMSELEQALG